MTVGVIDVGTGNIRSVEGKIRRLGHSVIIITKEQDPLHCQSFILPGVGHFAEAMGKLTSAPYFPLFEKRILEEKAPLLGICLGMQLLTSFSEEGNREGLNWIPGKTLKFQSDPQNQIRIPHVGWNRINWKPGSPLFYGIEQDKRFYFTHSYFVRSDDAEYSLASTDYGCRFDSAIQKENIYGVQFHPEKSHQYGLTIIENFLRSY